METERKPFGEQFSLEARLFGLSEWAEGNANFWYNVLQMHDTHGLPFDLIYVRLTEENRLSLEVPDQPATRLNSEQFEEFMKMTRYGAEVHGIGLTESLDIPHQMV